MRDWFRRTFFKSRNLKHAFEYNEKHFEDQIKRLKEEITILNKLVHKKESKVIEKPCFMSFYGNTAHLLDEEMQKQRDELRLEGYSFCHKKVSGDEIWAKY